MGIEFRIGNRKVPSGQWPREMTKELEKLAAKGLEEESRKRAASIRCPTHHKTGRVVRRGNDFVVEGCCEMFIDAFKKSWR